MHKIFCNCCNLDTLVDVDIDKLEHEDLRFWFQCKRCSRINEGVLNYSIILLMNGIEYIFSLILQNEIRKEINKELIAKLACNAGSDSGVEQW